jgi:hypothetical protein
MSESANLSTSLAIQTLRDFGPRLIDVGPLPRTPAGGPDVARLAALIGGWIQENLGIATALAYDQIVARPEGHLWHSDAYLLPDEPDVAGHRQVPPARLEANGGPAGLPWVVRPDGGQVQIAASVLLSDPATYEGGVLQIYDDDGKIQSFKEEAWGRVVLFGCSWKRCHRTTPNSGGRRAQVVWLKAV